MFMFDLFTLSWTRLASSSSAPTPRYSFGFTSAMGKIWVFGGWGFNGELQDSMLLRVAGNSVTRGPETISGPLIYSAC